MVKKHFSSSTTNFTFIVQNLAKNSHNGGTLVQNLLRLVFWYKRETKNFHEILHKSIKGPIRINYCGSVFWEPLLLQAVWICCFGSPSFCKRCGSVFWSSMCWVIRSAIFCQIRALNSINLQISLASLAAQIKHRFTKHTPTHWKDRVSCQTLTPNSWVGRSQAWQKQHRAARHCWKSVMFCHCWKSVMF
jgi:hypothetical protein